MRTLSPGKAGFCLATSMTAMVLAGATPALAQQSGNNDTAGEQSAQSTDQAADAQPTEVVVTGSRIARPELSMPNPVQVVTADTIQQSGKTNLTDFLLESPALLGSQGNLNAAGSNLSNAQNVGVNLLNLRNLGTSRTLVLVDGRRHVAGTPGVAAVDVNTIPTDLVERVETLTGGASAIYGADGVSGVVNFVLKDDFEGLRLSAQNSISQRGDAGSRFIAVTAGKNFAGGRGNVTAAYEFQQSDRFSQSDRLNYGKSGPTYAFVRNNADGTPGSALDDPNVPDRVLQNNLRWADTSMGGAIDLDGDGIPDFTGEGAVYDRGTLIRGTGFTIGGSSTPRETYFGDHTPYSRRHIANLMAKFEFSPALEVYAQGKYVRSTAYTYAQPSFDFATELQEDNAYLIERFGAEKITGPAYFGRDHFDLGVRRYEMERELWRTVVGARGEIASGLKYDVSYVFGQSTQKSTNRSDRITDRYYAALDAVTDPATGLVTCRINLPGETNIRGISYGNSKTYTGAPVTFEKGQCVPLNILGNGSPSQQAIDFVTIDHTNWARVKQHVVSAVVTGNTENFLRLPAGGIGFAVGAEYRHESSEDRPSEASFNDWLMDSAPSKIDQGSFNVKEVFAELNVPILKDTRFAHELSLGGAYRLSDYSTIGTTSTWNINGNYAPVRDVMFRATYSQAVRAPNITELFAGGGGTYQTMIDPCGRDRLGEGTSYRAANCAAALTAAGLTPDQMAAFDPANDANSPQNVTKLGFQGGNPLLNEETAKTWTAGVVLRPSFIRGLSITADWYNIKIKDAINYSSAQDIVDLCVDQPTLENIYCNAISRSGTTGYIDSFNVIPENVAGYETAGLDVSVSYRFTPFKNAGTFTLRAAGNYLDKLEFVPSVGADPENELEMWDYPAPRYSATFDLTWVKGPVTVNYGINWWSKTRRVDRDAERANPDYVAAEYLRIKEKWEHELFASYSVNEKFDFYLGINNLFDAKPDAGLAAYPVSAVGRSFYAGFKAKLF